jgi:DNA gyrase subunit A
MENTSNISIVHIEDEMRQSYMDYAMSVIVGRALPDIRDGLKPVQRRVLYAMYNAGLLSNKKHLKCANVVGKVLGEFHPHGDSSVYEALVRLAQPWTLRYPLVDGQGNFGSIDGDPAAAYRYTECRMTSIAEQLLADIDSETVDFSPNFDETKLEPVVLPTMVPNLLVNGSDGIAVGMATHIPPHNLTEVINATIALIKNPEMSLSELMQYIPGPDFPTGGIIFGRSSLKTAYSTGKGIIQLRAKAEIEQLEGKNRDISAIVITEIPFQVNKSRLLERTAELVNDKVIEGISKIRDESDRHGMRIVIEVKRDATPEVVLKQLFKTTPLQVSFGIINLAIVDGKPVVLSLAQMINHFVDHRRDVVIRRTQYELRKAKERMHILEGFRIALANIDEIITLIKKSESPKEAKENLCIQFKTSEIQAQAILDLRLQKLTGMERLAIEQEHQELAKEIARLLDLLSNSEKIDTLIISELQNIADKYGDERRTEITDDAGQIDVEDLIEDEEMVVTISHGGYAKRTSANSYRAQRRGGKGVTGASTKDEDFTEHLFVASTKDELLVFTTLGRLYWIKVYEIPESGRTAKGRALINLLNLKAEETISAILPVKEYSQDKFILMATKQGYIKKIELMEFSKSRKSGVIACTLNEGDSLVGVAISSGKDEIVLATKNGKSIRFEESDVRAVGRTARGVTGISLEDEDQMVSMTVVQAGNDNDASTLMTICENGYGKRTKMSDYRTQGRAGKGVIDIQTEGRNGSVVSAFVVDEESAAMLVTSGGKIIKIEAKQLSVIGRNTMGVRLIDLDEDEKVVAVCHVYES